MPSPLIFPVHGVYFRSRDTRLFVENITDPIVCALIHEPTNMHDTNAIKVMHGERHLGYVPYNLTRLFADRDNVPCLVSSNCQDPQKPFVTV